MHVYICTCIRSARQLTTFNCHGFRSGKFSIIVLVDQLFLWLISNSKLQVCKISNGNSSLDLPLLFPFPSFPFQMVEHTCAVPLYASHLSIYTYMNIGVELVVCLTYICLSPMAVILYRQHLPLPASQWILNAVVFHESVMENVECMDMCVHGHPLLSVLFSMSVHCSSSHTCH